MRPAASGQRPAESGVAGIFWTVTLCTIHLTIHTGTILEVRDWGRRAFVDDFRPSLPRILAAYGRDPLRHAWGVARLDDTCTHPRWRMAAILEGGR